VVCRFVDFPAQLARQQFGEVGRDVPAAQAMARRDHLQARHDDGN
jgi:hypothetical protein